MLENRISSIPFFAFLFICIVNLYADYTINHQLIYFSKPLIIISLAVFFILSVKRPIEKMGKLILFGLLFSLIGDTLLMFVENNPDKPYLFLLGLGSFLLTHVFYITAFFSFKKERSNWVLQNKWIVLPFLILLGSMLFYLWPDLNNGMKIPVAVYASVIVMMAIAALSMKNKIESPMFTILVAGVFLFIISDSLIAFNKFKSFQPFGMNPRISIMLTYMLAQFLIIFSCIKISKNNG